MAGISKQLLYKYQLQDIASAVLHNVVVSAIEKMRKDHRKMSSRKVYVSQKEVLAIDIGRDQFEQVAFANGYQLKHKRSC